MRSPRPVDRERERVRRAARQLAAKKRRRAAAQRRIIVFCVFCLIILVLLVVVLVGLFKAAFPGKSDIPVNNTADVSVFSSETDSERETGVETTVDTIPKNESYTEEAAEEASQKEKVTFSFSLPVSGSNQKSLSDDVRSDSAILVDLTDNRVMASLNLDKKVSPASLTKVMTLITAYEHINDIDRETFTMTYEILNPLVSSGNSLAGFEVGETVSMREYMYGMIMPSGADAAEAIAVYCGGSVKGFADMMNAKAKEMGLKNSHFTNPVGEYDKDNYSTVYDLAAILAYAYNYPELAEILNTYKYTTSSTPQHPDGLYFESNLQQRMKGDESGTCNVLGGKTGYTGESGHCVMCYAESVSDKKPYIFVACKGKAMYDPIFDCIDVLGKYVK